MVLVGHCTRNDWADAGPAITVASRPAAPARTHCAAVIDCSQRIRIHSSMAPARTFRPERRRRLIAGSPDPLTCTQSPFLDRLCEGKRTGNHFTLAVVAIPETGRGESPCLLALNLDGSPGCISIWGGPHRGAEFQKLLFFNGLQKYWGAKQHFGQPKY